MTKFIIFTNDDDHNQYTHFKKGKNPFTIMNLERFGEANILLIDNADATLIFDPNVNKEGFANKDILIHKDSTPSNENYFKFFVGEDNNVFVLLHTGSDDKGTDRNKKRKTDQKQAIKKFLPGKNLNFIEQHHSAHSIYRNELVEIAERLSISSAANYQKLLTKLQTYWPVPELEEKVKEYEKKFFEKLNSDLSIENQEEINSELNTIEEEITELCSCNTCASVGNLISTK